MTILRHKGIAFDNETGGIIDFKDIDNDSSYEYLRVVYSKKIWFI